MAFFYGAEYELSKVSPYVILSCMWWAPKGPATYRRLGVKDTECRDKEDGLVITALVLTMGLGQYATLRMAGAEKCLCVHVDMAY